MNYLEALKNLAEAAETMKTAAKENNGHRLPETEAAEYAKILYSISGTVKDAMEGHYEEWAIQAATGRIYDAGYAIEKFLR